MGHCKMNGFVNYTFGAKAICKLLIALHSLKTFSDIPVTIFFIEGDRHCEEIEPFIKENFSNVDIQWKYFEDKLNVREPFKVECLLSSPYEKTFLIDSDLLFTGPVDDIFDYLNDPNYIAVSRFSNWTVNNKKCKKHLKLLNRIKDPEKVREFFKDDLEYHNIGVFGVRKCESSIKFLSQWRDDMMKLISNFMCGEVTYNFLKWDYDGCVTLPEKFNRSYNYGKTSLDETSIIHFQGHGHRKVNRGGSSKETVPKFWEHMKKMVEENTFYGNWFNKHSFLKGRF